LGYRSGIQPVKSTTTTLLFLACHDSVVAAFCSKSGTPLLSQGGCCLEVESKDVTDPWWQHAVSSQEQCHPSVLDAVG